MFHNSCMYKVIIFASVCFAFGKPIEFSDPEITGNSFTVNFSATNQQSDEKSCYFAFTSDPSANFTCEIRLRNETLPCKNLASGWDGKDFLQWCSFELNSSPRIPEKITGTIHVTFSKNIFYGIKKNRISVNNEIIRIPSERPLLKTKSVNMPEHPFNIGVKIEIDKDGIYEIDVSELEKLGIPISLISSKSYRLFEKGKQIPIYIPGPVKDKLTSKDKILFYGQYLRGTNSHYEQFSNTNVYWLTWGNNVIGARITEVSGERIKDYTLYSSSGVMLAQSFPDTIHFEIDDDIRWLGDISNLPTELVTSSPENVYDEDNWYWGFMGDNELTEFTIPVPAPALDAYARLKICLMGLTSVDSIKPDHSIEILFNQNSPGITNKAIWDGQSKYTFYSETFSAKGIREGDNKISFICPQDRVFFDKSALNWIELEYSRLYRALNNHIVFKNPPESEKNVVEYSISGFTSENVELWDIKRNRFFTKFITEKVTDLKTTTYTLVFQDSLAVNTTYLAQAVSMHMSPSSMKLDTIVTNWNHILNSDYIAVSTDSFHTELQELLDVHSSRGLKTQFVDIDDIYNSFSWGIKDPESIRTMLKFLFSAGATPPRYLLLGGDTSHDLDKKNRSRNIVPTKLSRFSKWGPGANDSYFAMVSGDDNFADLVVGRFPAQNRVEMKTLVSKAVNYINNPQRGFWRDNILLLSGGEQIFTEFSDDIADNQIGLSMNAYRLDAHPGSKYYKDEFTASKQIADYINSGVYIVNFNGHGGGNIWSDNNFFGYKDLSKLYNGEWGKSGKLPVIFSFTCLTGFFESIFYRSLGEEFIRTDKNGAICFYGASAYTSNSGNQLFNKLLLENAIHGEFQSIGELIRFCETNMLARYGEQYLELVRQYNLLGDPALPWQMLPNTLPLTLANSSLVTGDSLLISGICSPVNNGTLRLIVKSGDQIWNQSVNTINTGSFVQSFAVKNSAKTASGQVRAYAWNDTAEVRGWVPFSKDSLMIFDAHLSLPSPSFGDSVFIKCRLSTDSSFESIAMHCNYAISPLWKPDINFTDIKMVNDSLDYWSSSEKVFLKYNGDINEKLLIRFRLVSNKESKESALFNFDLAGRSDLTFTDTSLNVFWDKDSLRCACSIINTGNLKTTVGKVHFFYHKDKTIQDTISVLDIKEFLEPGKILKAAIAIPDTSGTFNIGVQLNINKEIKEILYDNNTVYGNFSVNYADIMTVSDTLKSLHGGFSINSPKNFAQKYRVFLFEKTPIQNAPLKTESSWIPVSGNTAKAFQTGVRPSLAQSDSLIWNFSIQRNENNPENENISTSKDAIMYYDTSISSWRSFEKTIVGISQLSIQTTLSGLFATASLKDLTPPDIVVSVAGQVLNSLDYAAKNKPFTLFFADPSGILPSSISLTLNKKVLPSNFHSEIDLSNNLENMTIITYPQSENRVDSLTITAADLAGNSISRTFEYMPGENMSIKFLSCHPNPFTAAVRKDGVIQAVRFAYVLTDVASKVKLSIYTVSGKRIKQWSFSNIIGYQEIKWDGRDEKGFRIANGTYYAKLEASGSKRKVKKTIRIAKLEGY